MRMRIRSLMVAGPLVLAVMGPGTPAKAAAGPAISPANGSVVTSSSVRISVKTGFLGGQLYVNDVPRRSAKGSTLLTWTINGHSSPNGTYHVLLKDPVLALNNSTSTFRMAVPAYAPSGLQAKASGGTVTISWKRGEEPDLTGYTVSSSLGRSRSVGMGACGGGRCTTTLSVGANMGGQIAVQVVAKRKGAAPSGAAGGTVKLTGTGGGNGGNTNPVPPPNNNTWPAPGNNTTPDPFPTVQPGPDWSTVSPQPTADNPFSSPQAEPSVDTSLMPQPVADTRTASAADSLQWGKSVAIALVLLLCAGHLGTWTRRLRTARAGGPVSGPRIIPGSAHARVEANRHHIQAALAASRTITDEEDTKPKRRRFSKKRALSAPPAPDLLPSAPALDDEPGTLLVDDDLTTPAFTTTDHSPYLPPSPHDAGVYAVMDPALYDAIPDDDDPPYDSARSSADLDEPSSHAFADPLATRTENSEGPMSAARDYSGSTPDSDEEASAPRPESGLAALMDLSSPTDPDPAFTPDSSRTELLDTPRPRRLFRRGRRS
ncbi:hypothetical protein GCM10010468_35030 [Actinocorallia longicatena]|uniref:Ig-like domain-containing protein n=1 Tax=Actinocorallia longicatena TaxID=111803 RepID=A0ABP6QAH0_9ACTN